MFKIEYNQHGSFRIVEIATGHTGEWATFRDIATLKTEAGTYIAGSEYGLLPQAETVYLIAPHPTTLQEVEEDDKVCGMDSSELEKYRNGEERPHV